MRGFVDNIEKLSLENEDFRKVLYTSKNCQLVVMSIPQSEDIGLEVHHLDQFLRIEKGSGKVILDGIEHEIKDGYAVLVPAGTEHNVINTGDEELKIYTLYAPPNHRDGVIHITKAEAEKDEEEFNGKTTE